MSERILLRPQLNATRVREWGAYVALSGAPRSKTNLVPFEKGQVKTQHLTGLHWNEKPCSSREKKTRRNQPNYIILTSPACNFTNVRAHPITKGGCYCMDQQPNMGAMHAIA